MKILFKGLCFWERKRKMHGKFKEFTKDSEFTKENALKFGKEVSEKVAKRHK